MNVCMFLMITNNQNNDDEHDENDIDKNNIVVNILLYMLYN